MGQGGSACGNVRGRGALPRPAMGRRYCNVVAHAHAPSRGLAMECAGGMVCRMPLAGCGCFVEAFPKALPICCLDKIRSLI